MTSLPTSTVASTPSIPLSPSQGKSTFLDLLADTVKKQDSEKIFSTWYNDKGQETKKYTFAKLWDKAGAIAHILRTEWNVKKGDRVVLCYNFGLQFFAAFLGCPRAGITAVLVYPPAKGNLVKALPKLTKVVNDCNAKFILIDKAVLALKILDQAYAFSKSRNLWPKMTCSSFIQTNLTR